MDNFEFDLFIDKPISPEELFLAYYDCRKHKRNSSSALSFEMNLEHNLFVLLDEINNFSYKPQPYTCFIIEKPTVREVFAASFRDRIVHHLVINAINPFLEKRLIYDTYASRVGKGTHFGIGRLRHFMASSTNNWKEEAWCLKLDIKSFFASIDKNLLYKRLIDYLDKTYTNNNYRVICNLIEKIILTSPIENARIISPKEKWDKLDKSKSLFSTSSNKGLPIGNLTSQIFANFYMASLDHFIKHDLAIKMYGRYVDDFFLIHKDKDYLKDCLYRIAFFLKNELKLELNQKKVILQRVNSGVKFLGVKVEAGHTNIAKRTQNNFRSAIYEYNHKAFSHKLYKQEREKLLATINSYLGILSHYNTFNKRVELMELLSPSVLRLFKIEQGFKKVKLAH